MSDFGEGRTVKAGKQHQCIWCYDPVVVGEYHHHYKGMWESDWQDWRMHLDCLKACREEQDGDSEVHDEGHERGRTCEETENLRFKFKGELAEYIKDAIAKNESPQKIASMVLGDVEDWQGAEKIRVKKAREEAMKKPSVEVAS
jgi:hypothetical protein